MVAHTYDPSTWRQGISNSACPQLHNKCEANPATRYSISKGKKNQNPEKSSGKDRQAELRQKLNALWSRGSWERPLCPVKCAKRSRGTRLQVCIVLSVLNKINDLVGSHSEATRELLTALYLPRGTSCSRGNEVRLGQHLVPLP